MREVGVTYEMNRLDDAKVAYLRNGLRLLRIAKEQGLTDNLTAREREIRREVLTISEDKLRDELLKHCDDLLDGEPVYKQWPGKG
jgi:hypothetical protein